MVNFSKVKEHHGSKREGFEELVCQLANLEKPKCAEVFIRKNGNGGDAGVECYWTLNDGTEHCWQAKYFIEGFGESQWNQISDSVKQALEKHPKMTKYFIAIPISLTDARVTRKTGKTQVSQIDKWKLRVTDWKTIADKKGMDVEFVLWDEFVLRDKLVYDSPKMNGMKMYWFDAPTISFEKLKLIANESKHTLGPRFTPEYNLKLPISSVFECFGQTDGWAEKLDELKSELTKVTLGLDFQEMKKYPEIQTDNYEEASERFYSFFKNLDSKSIISKYTELQLEFSKIWPVADDNDWVLYRQRQKLENADENHLKQIDSVLDTLFDYAHLLSEIKTYIDSKEVIVAKSKALLISGEAGVGKSHLLCDVAIKRLERKLPTLFLLGQHYPGGNPLDFICAKFGFAPGNFQGLLGALDTFAKSYKTRLLIIIDAINEGRHAKDWYENISQVINGICCFENLAIVISCRKTYKHYLIPEQLEELVEIEHTGFSGYEQKALEVYLKDNQIFLPNVPILSPEFSNPLFLKTTCKAMKENKETTFPKGVTGFLNLFSYYIECVDATVGRMKQYRKGEMIVDKSIEVISQLLLENHVSGIPISAAREAIENLDPKRGEGKSLFDLLIDEGLIAEDISYSNRTIRGTPVIRFTYERFSDFAIANLMIKNISNEDELKRAFSKDGKIGTMIFAEKYHEYTGVLEALGIAIPEKFSREPIEFIDLEKLGFIKENWIINSTFIRILNFRSGSSISEKTKEYLHKYGKTGFYKKSIEVLLKSSCETEHPMNADYLNELLFEKEISERDFLWSTHIAINSEYEDVSTVDRLIDWAWKSDLNAANAEVVRLLGIILLWMTTTSNKRVRDRATKSLVMVFKSIPEKIGWFLEQYNNCNDPYLVERLYAAIYGSVLHIEDSIIVKDLAKEIYYLQFSNNRPFPNILIRDYARGIVEYALEIRVLSDKEVETKKIMPPYKSEWPLFDPNDFLSEDYFENSFNYKISRSLSGVLDKEWRYRIGRVENWLVSKLDEDIKTELDLYNSFVPRVPKINRKKYTELIKNRAAQESERIGKPVIRLINKINDFEAVANDMEHEQVDEWDLLKADILNSLSDKEKLEFEFICKHGFSRRKVPFDKKWAQNWVCKRAFDIGWSNEKFEAFEGTYSNSIEYSRDGDVERIGEKYQRIAFAELLSRMSDNLKWNETNYADMKEDHFMGAFQLNERDIDPTFPPVITPFENVVSQYDGFFTKVVEEQLKLVDEDSSVKEWINNKEKISEMEKMVEIINPFDGYTWSVLSGFFGNKRRTENLDGPVRVEEVWFRINTCIVKADEVESLKSNLRNQSLADPDIVNVSSNWNQSYFSEYPWHFLYDNELNWKSEYRRIKTKHHIPVTRYEWIGEDKSSENIPSFFMPSPQLINDLGLKHDKDNFGSWLNSKGEKIFCDPSILSGSRSYAMIKSDILNDWLEKKGMQLVWLVGGEKSSYYDKTFYQHNGSLAFNFLISKSKTGLVPEKWFGVSEEQKGN